MKQIKVFSMMLLLATMFVSFNACSSHDDNNTMKNVDNNDKIERVSLKASNLDLAHSGKIAQAAYSLGNGQWHAMPIQTRNNNDVVCAYYDDSWKPCWYVIESEINNKMSFVHDGQRYLIGEFK